MATSPPNRPASGKHKAMRDALLDATIESLVEVGYAATSARGVAKRAGVSQGAQQHYFPSKAELIDAAFTRLMAQLAMQDMAEPFAKKSERERASAYLDRLWEIHNLPVSHAVLEVFLLARTDTEVAQRVSRVVAQAMIHLDEAGVALLPELGTRADVREWMQLAQATMRGIVLMQSVPGLQEGFVSWPIARRHLLMQLDALIAARRGKGK